jgi:hypothetical protein
MNIEYANTIPVREILNKFHFQPLKTNEHILVFQSPFGRQETDFLTVNTKTNKWFDEVTKRKGDGITLVRLLLKELGKIHAQSDALNWIKRNIGYIRLMLPNGLVDHYKADSDIIVRSVEHISAGFLIRYLEDIRKIPFDTARFLLKEVTFAKGSSRKELKAIGLVNEDGGVALRSEYFKAHSVPRNITFIRGKDFKPNCIHIFKDVFDYLSATVKACGKPPHGDVIILNSLQCMKQADAYISKYGYLTAYTWLDNSVEGFKATKAFRQFFKSEHDLRHIPMNSLYREFKDVNEWLIATT